MWATRILPGLVTLALTWMAIMMVLALVDARPTLQVPRKRAVDNSSVSTASAAESPSAATHKTSKPAKQTLQQYQLEVLSPSPNDLWTSGMVETLSWADLSLPPGATLDISLILAEPETNPVAIQITRRPILRYIDAMERHLDLVVPYDLITKEQLIMEQEGDGETIPNEGIESDNPSTPTKLEVPANLTRATTKPAKDIRSQARLYITAYEGRTNKILAQVSVFPIEIRKDHARDRRTVLPPPVTSASPYPDPAIVQEEQQEQNIVDESTEDALAKKDSDITHLEDNMEENDQGTEGEGEDGEDEESKMLDSNNNGDNDDAFDMSIHGDGLGDNSDGQSGTEGGDEDVKDEGGMDMAQEQHSEHGAGSDEDTHDDHDPAHVMDPDYFQSEEDAKIWKEHENDPGYNPPTKIVDAGELKITHWIDNKVRFFVGAPYVFAWDYPDSGKDLTGVVNVYVEDAFTGKRYDVVAGNLPSEILFMYLHPSAVMMSTSPGKRIYLRARVEMDLLKAGDIHRFTGFSKAFWVERGAL